MSTEWQHVVINIPDGYTREERMAIGQDMVDRVRERTQNSNVDKNGKALAAYSKEYVESLDFKNAGKSKGDVNFTQSGDTLGALDVLSTDPGRIVIGWEKGSESNAIADGNIRGTFGHANTVGPRRDILGLTEQEVNRILAAYPLDNPDQLDQSIQEYLLSKEAGDGG